MEGHGKFARATYDSTFKHLMLDPEVRLSFLRTFTGVDIVEVMNYPVSLPALKPEGQPKSTQKYMDFACRLRNGMIFIAEVQIYRENHWDPRCLYYAAGVYSRQLAEGDSWSLLQNVMAIHILDLDSGTLTKPGDFEKHYMMTDALHPETQWPYIQIRQFEIPRINFDLIPDGAKKQWLRIFKESMTMDHIPSDFDPIIQKALGYLDKKTWGGDLIAECKSEELHLEKYTTAMQQERNHGLREGELSKSKEIALVMIKEGDSLERISRITGLSELDLQKMKEF
ncbi:MAG: Rpn family recombination-promoting nuclease/putative transposase [Alphaproteobacteria bacterium]|nr:Rpn family recombination-promoting nuclease/putative transposase [Alphaproteobacteria bacterium]